MSADSFAVRRAHLSLVLLIAVASSVGCAASQRHELAPGEVHAALETRSNGPLASLAPEQLAGLETLALARPTPDECADPHSSGYWRACALAWNPSVRAARRELERALAVANVAGLPGSIDVALESLEFADLERETKLAATIDLLGLIGVGPTRIAREAARGEVTRAHSALESAVWSALFEVQRARVRLAASRERTRYLNVLLKQVAAQSERFEILERRGRLSEADAEMVQAAGHDIEHALSRERSREAELHAELARLSGLPFEHAAYASVDGTALNEARQFSEPAAARELLEQDPALRELSLEYAQAELRVRRVAADAWPSLRVGPQLTFMPSDVLLGGVLDLALPWPGRVEKEIRIASAEREAARERVEDALNLALARVASLRVDEAEARLRASEHAPKTDSAAESAWQAINARLRVGMASALEWTRVLRERVPPLSALVDEREGAAIAALDLAQACGVVPRSEEAQP